MQRAFDEFVDDQPVGESRGLVRAPVGGGVTLSTQLVHRHFMLALLANGDSYYVIILDVRKQGGAMPFSRLFHELMPFRSAVARP
jgi:hypothetical protein